MRTDPGIEDLLRELAPQVLGTLVRRHGRFDACEDAVQEALLAAALQWVEEGLPESPRAWLLAVASRRLVDDWRVESARRQREETVGALELADPGQPLDHDDTLTLLFMCCHPSLSAPSQLALTLRAVGGLTTAEIANAFLVPEATMAQRISRAKQRIKSTGIRFTLPPEPERDDRLRVVLHVLYLVFNEGYTTTSGTALHRADLTSEAIRLARMLHQLMPEEGEVVPFRRPYEMPLKSEDSPAKIVASLCTPFRSIEDVDLAPLLRRIGDAKVVLLGEATHGTSEFYRMRERISQELIAQKNFTFVAIEGDWPDAARIDHYVRHFEYPPSEWTAFARFPRWMWRNNEVRAFVDWMRKDNASKSPQRRTAFYGLDLYSLYTSIGEVLRYLDRIDPETAGIARHRYGCLTPWQNDPAAYGHAALTGTYKTCEMNVVHMLRDILIKQNLYMARDGERFNDAVHNARLVANAERYYRVMYYGSRASWNLRDGHMFETLQSLLAFHGRDSKAIVWAHNSHVGNAAATEMSARGETNIGELCRKEFGDHVYSIGFGTHSGHVAAASDWDGPMEIKPVQPSRKDSYERLFHDTDVTRFLLPMRTGPTQNLRNALMKPRLERAIGVIYRPDTELASHYFQAVLPQQFDEYIWFDETSAVSPFETLELTGLPDTYPFGL